MRSEDSCEGKWTAVFESRWQIYPVSNSLFFDHSSVDFFRGLLTGKSLLKELKFIASRIAVTILLRDRVRTNAILDNKDGYRSFS